MREYAHHRLRPATLIILTLFMAGALLALYVTFSVAFEGHEASVDLTTAIEKVARRVFLP